MSSLPLLNELTGSSSGKPSITEIQTLMCSPAVLALVVGSGLVVYSIAIGHLHRVGIQLAGTLAITLVIGMLCFSGFTSVGWAVLAVPLVIVMSLVVIIILTLMLTSRDKHQSQPRPRHSPRHPPTQPSMSDAYKYVMTGKGFGLIGR